MLMGEEVPTGANPQGGVRLFLTPHWLPLLSQVQALALQASPPDLRAAGDRGDSMSHTLSLLKSC